MCIICWWWRRWNKKKDLMWFSSPSLSRSVFPLTVNVQRPWRDRSKETTTTRVSVREPEVCFDCLSELSSLTKRGHCLIEIFLLVASLWSFCSGFFHLQNYAKEKSWNKFLQNTKFYRKVFNEKFSSDNKQANARKINWSFSLEEKLTTRFIRIFSFYFCLFLLRSYMNILAWNFELLQLLITRNF